MVMVVVMTVMAVLCLRSCEGTSDDKQSEYGEKSATELHADLE